MNIQQLRAQIAALQDATMDENKNFRSAYDEGKFDALSAVDALLDSLQEEPVSKDFEEALAREWQGYNDRGAAKVDALEDNTQELAFAKGFYRGWHYMDDDGLRKATERIINVR